MNTPNCIVLPECLPFKRVETRSIRYDGELLTVELQGEGFVWLRIVFRDSLGFRILDERDLSEFWSTYSEPNGWLYEVLQGGWMELELTRKWFSSPSMFKNLREYFLVGDKCISVLCQSPPEFESLGADPPKPA